MPMPNKVPTVLLGVDKINIVEAEMFVVRTIHKASAYDRVTAFEALMKQVDATHLPEELDKDMEYITPLIGDMEYSAVYQCYLLPVDAVKSSDKANWLHRIRDLTE